VNALDAQASAELAHLIEGLFHSRTSEDWSASFEAKGVPCAPVRLTAELFDDPQVEANEYLVNLEHPVVGPIRMANSPVRMSGAETGTRMSSPALGQHSRVFLGELGYSAAEIERLEQDGVVTSWQRPA
jgi:crotonobetainyl-CoA:carnitine CoA-transferase CaiB-like acyl-CoA transferase